MLEGVPLPVTKRKLLAYARREDIAAANELQSLSDRTYRSIDEIGEALSSVQPSSPRPEAVVPREESDTPPGGEAYLDPGAVPGWVRPSAPATTPPQKVLEQQTETQKKQQERQKQLGQPPAA